MPTVSKSSFTRPGNTTAYTSGDLVADNTVAASVTPLIWTTSKVVGQGTIMRVRFYKSDPTATNANFTVHIFSAAPGTPSNGDNGAIGIASALYHIASVACDLTTGGFPATAGLSKQFTVTNGITFDQTNTAAGERRLWGLIEAKAAYSPADSEVFEVGLEIVN